MYQVGRLGRFKLNNNWPRQSRQSRQLTDPFETCSDLHAFVKPGRVGWWSAVDLDKMYFFFDLRHLRCQYEQSKTSPAQRHHCTCPRLLLSMKEVPLWMRVLSSQTVQCWPSIENSPSCLLSIVVSLAIGRCCTPSVQVLYFTADVGVCIGRQRHAFKALQTVCAVDFVHKLQAFYVRMLGCWARRHIFTCFHHFLQTPSQCLNVTMLL